MAERKRMRRKRLWAPVSETSGRLLWLLSGPAVLCETREEAAKWCLAGYKPRACTLSWSAAKKEKRRAK